MFSSLYWSLHWKIKEKYLLKRCNGKYFPIKLKSDKWAVNTEHGLEFGCVSYVAGEFCGDNLVYNYKINNCESHKHSFDGVIEALMLNPKTFSVKGFEEEYSSQELKVLYNLQEAYQIVSARNTPLTHKEKVQNCKRNV